RGLGVECLAEFHDIHALRTERGSHRRRRRRFAGRNLELYVTVDLLCHCKPFREWEGGSRKSAIVLFTPTTYYPLPTASFNLFQLQEIQFYRCRAAEDGHQDAQGIALGMHFVNFAGEVVERAVDDADVLVLFETELRTGPLGGARLAVEDRVHFVRAERD